MSLISEIFLQAFYYLIVMVITFLFVGVLQRGFFGKFFRVKLSFGKLILVKLREVNRDPYAIGIIREGFLIFKYDKDEYRISIPKNKPVIYRSIGVNWVDVDPEKGAVCVVDYSAVSGFDAVKYNNLYLRALYKPALTDNFDKILLVLVIVSIIASIVVGFLVYQNSVNILEIKQFISQTVPTVSGSNSL